MSGNHGGTLGNDGAARTEPLLAAVRDVVASLQRVSALLDHELTTPNQAVPPEHLKQLESLRTENAQLREALSSRAVIEQAKGMLMAQHECDAETAFRMLVAASRRDGRKVRDVAASMVSTSSLAGRREADDARAPGTPSVSVVTLPDAGQGPATPARVAVGARPGTLRRAADLNGGA